MIITKEEFEAYEKLRLSKPTTMWDIKLVSKKTKLEKTKVIYIIQNYTQIKRRIKEGIKIKLSKT